MVAHGISFPRQRLGSLPNPRNTILFGQSIHIQNRGPLGILRLVFVHGNFAPNALGVGGIFPKVEQDTLAVLVESMGTGMRQAIFRLQHIQNALIRGAVLGIAQCRQALVVGRSSKLREEDNRVHCACVCMGESSLERTSTPTCVHGTSHKHTTVYSSHVLLMILPTRRPPRRCTDLPLWLRSTTCSTGTRIVDGQSAARQGKRNERRGATKDSREVEDNSSTGSLETNNNSTWPWLQNYR